MSNETRIHDIFQQPPTRDLEEVQKVNARERAENDVQEFYETESAENVLTTLGDLVDRYPHEESRFLYISATFGSGKTHLMKLAGFAADTESDFSDLGEELAMRWPGFRAFRESIATSHVDRLKPVFLNLLNRDASQEPPLPYLIYEAIGRELGYPTDPNWLLEWAWQLDMDHDGIWDQLQTVEHDGKTFDEVLDERATLRTWLYEAVPTLDGVGGTRYETRELVRDSIEAAIEEVNPDSFDPDDLVERIEEAQAALSEDGTETELLLGLDEVALFIGDGRNRYREFQETMTALVTGPNPPVVGTGQYPLGRIHGEFDDSDATEQGWYGRQEPLEGADTEVIVRKRWLQKSEDGATAVREVTNTMPDLSLDSRGDIPDSGQAVVESYPFRGFDLGLLRQVIQQLMPGGQIAQEEYVQGRALLILVRSLFTRFEWGEKPVGALVTWDELFDLLVEETTYVPLWVQEMVENKLVPSADGDEDAMSVRVAKALYLANQVRADVPSTPENVSRLMIDSVDASLDDVTTEIETTLRDLVEDRKVLTETNEEGDEEYLLVSEEQEDILTRAKTRAREIPSHRLSAKLETLLRESSDHLLSAGSRHEVDFENERRVPLRFEYSILDPIEKAPTPEFDAVRVRLLAGEPDDLAEQVEAWQATNEGRNGGEHILIAVKTPKPTVVDRLRSVMGMSEILSEETESHPDLESDQSDEELKLESTVREKLDEASVYVRRGESRGDFDRTFESVIKEEVQSVFGGTRHVLSTGITEVPDAEQMARFFRGVADWPLSSEDAVMLGVDTDDPGLEDGWCREFLDEFGERQSMPGEQLLQQTVQRGGAYRGTPRESLAALLITLATANKIALKRDDDYITDPAAIGRAVRNKTRLTEIQIRFESLDGIDPDQIQGIVRAITGESTAGSDPDAWLSELATWVAENSVHVKRIFRGVRREFGGVSLDALEETLEPALDGEELDAEDIGTDTIEEQAEQFDRARELFQPNVDGETFWDRYTAKTSRMQQLYPGADVTGGMQSTVARGTVPDIDSLRDDLTRAEDHRQSVVRNQFERITGDLPDETEPDAVVSSLSTWLFAHDGTSKETADQIVVEFEGVDISDLYELLETAWYGDDFAEAELVSPAVIQQAKTFARARRLIESSGGESSLWSTLREASRQLEDDYPNHPITTEVKDTLEQSQPPEPERVQELLEEAQKPFNVHERLQELARQLEADYPGHETTEEVATAVDAAEPPNEARAAELIEDAERLLEGTTEQLRRIQETIDDLEDGSVILIESLD